MSGKILPDPEGDRGCTSWTHNPPMHLVIPAGKVYEHTCDACGLVTIVRPTAARW